MEYVDKVENTNHSDEIVEEEEESKMWWHQIATVLDKSYPKKNPTDTCIYVREYKNFLRSFLITIIQNLIMHGAIIPVS